MTALEHTPGTTIRAPLRLAQGRQPLADGEREEQAVGRDGIAADGEGDRSLVDACGSWACTASDTTGHTTSNPRRPPTSLTIHSRSLDAAAVLTLGDSRAARHETGVAPTARDRLPSTRRSTAPSPPTTTIATGGRSARTATAPAGASSTSPVPQAARSNTASRQIPCARARRTRTAASRASVRDGFA